MIERVYTNYSGKNKKGERRIHIEVKKEVEKKKTYKFKKVSS